MQLSPSQREPVSFSAGSLICNWESEGCMEIGLPSLPLISAGALDCNSELTRPPNPRTISLKSPFWHLFPGHCQGLVYTPVAHLNYLSNEFIGAPPHAHARPPPFSPYCSQPGPCYPASAGERAFENTTHGPLTVASWPCDLAQK